MFHYLLRHSSDFIWIICPARCFINVYHVYLWIVSQLLIRLEPTFSVITFFHLKRESGQRVLWKFIIAAIIPIFKKRTMPSSIYLCFSTWMSSQQMGLINMHQIPLHGNEAVSYASLFDQLAPPALGYLSELKPCIFITIRLGQGMIRNHWDFSNAFLLGEYFFPHEGKCSESGNRNICSYLRSMWLPPKKIPLKKPI